MSYRGRPSKGCEVCRARKVKCDENKPECNRCSKSGRECRYRDQDNLFFRNQTPFAAQKAEESWRKRSKSNQHVESDHSDRVSPQSKYQSPGSTHTDSPDTLSSNRSLDVLSLSHDSQTNLRRASYERFLYDFVISQWPGTDASQASEGVLEWLPTLYEKSPEGSCFKTVVDAISYANYSARHKVPEAKILAEECAGKGIQMLRRLIADKQQAATDDALGSVYVLGMYENLTSSIHDGSFLAHKEGANALLRLRSVESYYSNPISANLYEATYTQMLLGELHSAKTPSIPIQDILMARQMFLGDTLISSGIYVIQLIHSVATLHAKWREMKFNSNPPSNRQELKGVLREAIDVDADYHAWESTVPPQWKYKELPNTPETWAQFNSKLTELMTSRGAPPEIHTYSSLRVAWLWMFYHSSRIFLLRDTIEILNWMLNMPELVNTDASKEDSRTLPLDNVSLRVRHHFATMKLVEEVDAVCSTVIGHFIVPIHGKSNEELHGMAGVRGYISLWPSFVVVAMSRLGLIPSSEPNSSSIPQLASSTISRKPPGPSQFMLRVQEMNMASLYYESEAAVLDLDGLPRLDLLPLFGATPAIRISSPTTQKLPSPGIVQSAKRVFIHTFAAHPFDFPNPSLPELDLPLPEVRCIDVRARREWMHGILRFIASELGIRKGLAMLKYQNYLDSSKTVESLHRQEAGWDMHEKAPINSDR
ncbi:hypothetical protein CC78DRAFT_126080 [Lojkania enalia]|uniref:Zn(2)-C6 fungal-type domain-containing protein n=1 Tax=Lojkania enalia TaxID=147567 RepID=A0A9P4K0A9_9PLEO|nr:hypothetical protein CC78DRAFT_126080 [Didymosphaeria enalia]